MTIDDNTSRPADPLGEPSPIMRREEPGLHPGPADSVFDAMPEYQPTVGISPVDGLPVDQTPDFGADAYAPSLDPRTFVCMRDKDEAGQVIREQCIYYARQRQSHPDMPGVLIVQRWCTHPAIMTTNGALCLRDSEVPSCEMRDPPHCEDGVNLSQAALDKFDDELVRKGRSREYLQVFRTPEDVASGRTKIS